MAKGKKKNGTMNLGFAWERVVGIWRITHVFSLGIISDKMSFTALRVAMVTQLRHYFWITVTTRSMKLIERSLFLIITVTRCHG